MTVTPIYAGVLTLLFLLLSVRVVRWRQRNSIALGDGGNSMLLRVIRGQANFAEYVPLALLLMLILEQSRFSIYVLHGLGMMLLLGRILHGYALSFTPRFQFGRVAGASLTFVVLLIEAVMCIYQGVLAQSLWFST